VEALKKIIVSSTAVWTVILSALKILLEQLFGIVVPWEMVGAGVGAYAIRGAAAKIGDAKVEATAIEQSHGKPAEAAAMVTKVKAATAVAKVK
jgi:hypothetical protein